MTTPYIPDPYGDTPPSRTDTRAFLPYAAEVMWLASKGKQVQSAHPSFLTFGNCSIPIWDWNSTTYRIAPSERPVRPKKLAPFASREEFLASGIEWVRVKTNPQRAYAGFSAVATSGCLDYWGNFISWESMALSYEGSADRGLTWLACGKYVEEGA